MIDWSIERQLIKAECLLWNIDHRLLMALRVAENGGDGRQFGVLSVSAPTYAEQLHIAARTVAHRLWTYPGNPLTATPYNEVVVSVNWAHYFASIWAPQGVANDPHGLNVNWTKDFLTAYHKFIEDDRQSRLVSKGTPILSTYATTSAKSLSDQTP